MYFYVFIVTEREPDEDDLGPSYRMVTNPEQVREPVGAWDAKDGHQALRIAAKGRDEIFAAFPTDTAVIDRWPFTIDEFANHVVGEAT